MDIAAIRSSYAQVLQAYEVSVNKFLSNRKKSNAVFFWGTAISLALFVAFFVFPPVRQANTISDLRTGMDQFIVICLCAVGGIFFAWQARTLSGASRLPEPEPSSEKEYELALGGMQDQLEQTGTLIRQQKKLSGWSLGLYLVSDVMLIALMIAWAN